jgi:hypothetical protein
MFYIQQLFILLTLHLRVLSDTEKRREIMPPNKTNRFLIIIEKVFPLK